MTFVITVLNMLNVLDLIPFLNFDRSAAVDAFYEKTNLDMDYWVTWNKTLDKSNNEMITRIRIKHPVMIKFN